MSFGSPTEPSVPAFRRGEQQEIHPRKGSDMATKAEMIEAVADAAGMSKADTERTLGAFFDHVTAEMKKDEAVTWPGFGKFSTSKRAARTGRNPQTGEVTVTATNTGGYRYPWGTETYREAIGHKTSDAHPENTSMLGTHRMEVTLKDRVLLWEAQLSFTSDANNFYYQYTRKLSENGKLLREKTWTDRIPRDFQ